jgi:hypothetical protein
MWTFINIVLIIIGICCLAYSFKIDGTESYNVFFYHVMASVFGGGGFISALVQEAIK